VLEATHARPRLVLAAHPVACSHDAFWLVAGRLVDWGPIGQRADPVDLQRRTKSALTRAPRPGELATHLPPGEVDEIRIMATYLASHPETPQLVLDPAPGTEALERFISSSTAYSRTTSTS
jgi:hypothetical protein